MSDAVPGFEDSPAGRPNVNLGLYLHFYLILQEEVLAQMDSNPALSIHCAACLSPVLTVDHSIQQSEVSFQE